MDINNIEQLKKLSKVFNTDNVITSAEIEQVLAGILTIMSSFKKDNENLTKEATQVVNDLLDKVISESDNLKKETSITLDSQSKKIMSDVEDKLLEVKRLIKEAKATKPKNGKDANEPRIIKSVLDQIKLPEYKPTLLDTPKEIKDKLETLNGDDRLDISAIKGIDKLATQANLERGISILDQRTQFLINKTSTSGTSSPLTTKGDVYTYSTTNDRLPVGANGTVLTADSSTATGLKWAAVTGTGTVTDVSVTSANGFAGSVATSTTTPAITISTTVTGLLKGNGTAVSAAVANTDYQSPITLTTTGTSGAATFNGTTLNIPNYTSGGGTPGGSDTQLQYNNAGAFGGITGATTDGTITTFSSGNLKASDVTASGSGGIALKNSGGTSIISIGSGGGTNATIAAPTNIGSNSADYIQIAGNTGSTTQTATGSSTDININLIPKGTGRLQEGGINVLNTNSVLDDLSNVQVSTPNTNDHLAWNGSAWIPVPTTQVVGSASVFYLDNTLAVADNKSLSITPSAYAETTNTASADADINGGVAFLERFVSGSLGRTTIPAGVWDFSTFAKVSAVTGANFIETRVNKRVEQTGMTATFTGAGATRTLTVTGGTPFVAGDVGDGTELTATLVETPNQTCWISGFTSSSQVTVTLTDSGYVNESGVSLSALYYLLFRSTSSDIASTGVAEVSYNTTQPEFTGLNAIDRIVVAYFGRTTSATARNFTLYHGGSENYSHFHSPLTTQHNDLAGLNNGDFKHLTSAEYTGTGTGNFVRATSPVLTTPNLGTPSALTLTNATGLPIAGLVSSTSTALGVGSIELGNASDTTISRSSAGVIAVEGVVVPTASSTTTFTNKRIQPRTASSTTASTLTPDLSSASVYYRTTQTATLTINAPTGTPVTGETIMIYVDSASAQTLTIDATYVAFGAAFPATTTAGKTFMMSAQYNGTDWKTTWANQI